MTNEEKLNFLYELETGECCSTENKQRLIELSEDSDEEVRIEVAAVLACIDIPEKDDILVKLSCDKDSLVRVNACDSLGTSISPKIIEVLKERIIRDKDSLVRSYSVLSICDIAISANLNYSQIIKFLENRLEKEKIINTKISFYRSLYLLGEEKYLDEIIETSHNRNYRNRCAAVNALKDIANIDNSDKIRLAVLNLKTHEKSLAVLSSCDNVLQHIYNFND
jgi:HEAT repeat protein